jgi:hypothetical protein
MNEFKLPKKKQWQTGSESVGKYGPLHGTTAPDFTPEAVGVIYVNISALVIYISIGVSSPSDWVQIWAD